MVYRARGQWMALWQFSPRTQPSVPSNTATNLRFTRKQSCVPADKGFGSSAGLSRHIDVVGFGGRELEQAIEQATKNRRGRWPCY